MWFDTIIVDNIGLDGILTTYHIRSRNGEKIPTDMLEKIDTEYQADASADIGPLRMYQLDGANINILKVKLKNVCINSSNSELYIQFDHFAIPVTAGYYACVFPKGWRITEINVYDPYSTKGNVAEKRSYRDVSLIWDPISKLSSTQFEMTSNRGTFSLGVIAKLKPNDSGDDFMGKEHPLSVIFSDTRHQGHPLEEEYRKSSDAVVDRIKNEQAKSFEEMPSVNLGLAGPSIDIMAWGRFIMNKIRKPNQ